jgi:hypothetical protein
MDTASDNQVQELDDRRKMVKQLHASRIDSGRTSALLARWHYGTNQSNSGQQLPSTINTSSQHIAAKIVVTKKKTHRLTIREFIDHMRVLHHFITRSCLWWYWKHTNTMTAWLVNSFENRNCSHWRWHTNKFKWYIYTYTYIPINFSQAVTVTDGTTLSRCGLWSMATHSQFREKREPGEITTLWPSDILANAAVSVQGKLEAGICEVSAWLNLAATNLSLLLKNSWQLAKSSCQI